VKSTTTRTTFVQEALEAIPTSRNSLTSVLIQTPGVRTGADVGGSSTGLQPRLQAFGRVGQSSQQLEGIETREQTGGATGTYYDFNALQEVQFQTMANDADASTSGMQVNAIIKSGSNTLHGSFLGSRVSPKFQSSNVDAALAAQGITQGNPLLARWDAGGDLGGRIVRDKLWFYGGARQQENRNLVIGLVRPDGTPGDQPLKVSFATMKLSYQMNQRSRLVFFSGYQKKSLDGGGSVFVPWESRYTQRQPGAPTKLEWNGLFGDSLTVALQAGRWWYNSRKGDFSSDVATFDVGTQKYTGEQIATYLAPGYAHNWRPQYKGTLNWYKKDWAGNHAIKAGFDIYNENRSEVSLERPGGDYSLQFLNGAPYRVVTYNIPVIPLNEVNYTGAFLQDSWSVTNKLTLNVGVRFDRYNMFLPEQSRDAGPFAPATTFPRVGFNVWNEVVPRLHLAYDLSGDGKTVLKGGWGRFGEMRQVYEAVPYNSNASQQTTWIWHDLNGNRRYDAGEVNLDTGGPDFVSLAAFRGATGSTVTLLPNLDERQPTLDELSITLERELVANLAIRASGIFSRGFDNRRLLNAGRPPEAYTTPITNPDPGPDGRAGTADDPGTTFTYYDYPASLSALAFQRNTPVNDPDYVDTWKTFELAATKRLSSNWQLLASFSATRRDMKFPQTDSARVFPPLTPNDGIFTADKTWEWVGKVSGSYQFPWDISAAANFQSTSGDAYARQVLFTGGRQIASIVLNVEPIGSHRLREINLLDLRVEKSVRMRGVKASVRVDLFNALNTNVATGVNVRSGPTFGNATTIVPPRIAMAGASFSF
jgi:TonB dependent receptor-like, beta-barrel